MMLMETLDQPATATKEWAAYRPGMTVAELEPQESIADAFATVPSGTQFEIVSRVPGGWWIAPASGETVDEIAERWAA